MDYLKKKDLIELEKLDAVECIDCGTVFTQFPTVFTQFPTDVLKVELEEITECPCCKSGAIFWIIPAED